MPISSPITLATDSIISNTGSIRIPNIQIPANVWNLDVKRRQQTTISDVVNTSIGDGHVQKENSHTTEDKIKGNTYNCFTEARNGNYEGKQKTGNMTNMTTKFLWKATSKNTSLFGKKR